MVKNFKIFLFAAIPSIVMTVIMLLLYPLFLHPEFTKEIVKEAQKDSQRVAAYFIKEYYPAITLINKLVPSDLEASIQRDIDIFNLWKIRFFNPDGEILYSSEKAEIGNINKKPYFVELVAKGHIFSNMVKKEGDTKDGTPTPYDVVETYIPIMLENTFNGAFEVYVNVTEQMQRLKALFWRSYIIFSLVICILLILIVVFSFRMDKAAKERENIILELQDAFAEVTTLRGIIPICASCKKVRDDKGYWNQIESYIRDHSEADFSHSICPECAKELYPDLKIYD
jgi:energy-coupling factor transporter transmembrane protein EcfT